MVDKKSSDFMGKIVARNHTINNIKLIYTSYIYIYMLLRDHPLYIAPDEDFKFQETAREKAESYILTRQSVNAATLTIA